MISIVVPSYNEEENVRDCSEALERVLEGEEHEIIFVDDGSHDRTWDEILSVSSENIRGVRFSRNFGKEWRAGADVVEGKKSFRGHESRSHGLSAALFNKMMSRATGCDMSGASDFILLDKKAVEAVRSYNEQGSFFRALAQFVGFRHETVYYEVGERKKGKGKFTLKILTEYALKNIASFTAAPLFISLILGIISVFAAIILIILKLFGINLSSITAGIIILILLGGMILCCLGIIGFYLSRIYEEIKRRPRYIISEKTGGR